MLKTKTALIVIDFINDIVHPEGKIPSCAEQVLTHSTIEAANRTLAWARKSNHLIIQVKVGFDAHYHAQPKRSPMFGKANEYGALNLQAWGTKFHEKLDVQDNDMIIVKPRVSPFYGTPLDAVLRANRVEKLIICGVSTTWAIQACVREAHDRDYELTIIEDACAAHTQDEHTTSIQTLQRLTAIKKSTDLN